MQSESLFVDRTVVDLDELAVGCEEVGTRHSDAPVLGDRHPVVIEVMREGEVELVEKESSAALAVVVVDADESNFLTEFGVCLSKQRGFGPAGEAPGRPHVDDRRPIKVGQHLLEPGQIDLGQFGSDWLGLLTGSTSSDQENGNEKTAHLDIMGGYSNGGFVAGSRTGARVEVGVGAGLVALGLWAMVDPQSFFERIASFEPYNQHFLQDLGALQIGLGAVLLLAGMIPALDALTVALVGVGVGAALHAVSHVIGIDLGGRPAIDIPVFGGLAVALLVVGAMRWRRH